jgi:ethanolamine utilization protein EutQ (cupin superfamily)
VATRNIFTLKEEQDGLLQVTENEAKWAQFDASKIFLGDIMDETNSKSMGVGYARYDKGESNEWTVTYDEVLVILKGSFTVEFDNDSVTAGPGEIIWLEAGTPVVYKAIEEVRLVYVTYPVWGSTEGTKANAGALRAVSSPTDQAGSA